MKLVVIGAGSIGRQHALNLKDKVDSCALYDQETEQAELFAKENGLDVLSSIEEVANWSADGVIISTPHTSHVEIAKNLLGQVSNILIEKPISNQLDATHQLLEESHSKNCNIFVVSNMRYHPAINCIAENIDRLGKIYYARAQFGNYLPNMRPDADYKKLYCAHKAQGGGVIMDVIHEIDYLRWLFGPVTSVQCTADKLSDLDIDVEDYAHIVAKHENNIRSEIHMDYLKPYKRRGCEVVGELGHLIWQSEGKTPEECRVKFFDKSTGTMELLFEDKDLDKSLAFQNMLEDFIKQIKDNDYSSKLSTGGEGLAALKVVLASYESVNSKGMSVEISENQNDPAQYASL